MRIRFSFKYLLIILMSMMFAGCSLDDKIVKKYGIKYNHIREKLGIPLIPANWRVEDIMDDCFDFVNPNPNMTGPHRLGKRIFINQDGAISRETDTFYSGRTFYDAFDGNTLSESIYLEYNYFPSKDKKKWVIYLTESPDKVSEEITKKEAKKMLKKWGFKSSVPTMCESDK